jgi:hypothetical protein
MRFNASRFAVAALLAATLGGCGSQESSLMPATSIGGTTSGTTAAQPLTNIAGVYKGTVVETAQGESIKEPLKITIKQSGEKFTGIFDVILKTISDEFPIIKGRVVSLHGKTILHFVIEGSPGRNARATASLVGGMIKGRAKVSGKHGPVVHFKYSAKKT